MNYNRSVTVRAREELDFEAAKVALLPNDFALENDSENSMSFSGKGMTSTSQPAVKGATKINLEYKAGKLHLNAKLGGVLFMALFTALFPPALMIGISMANNVAINYVPILVWAVLSPAIIFWLRSRTVNALNHLLRSVTHKDNIA